MRSLLYSLTVVGLVCAGPAAHAAGKSPLPKAEVSKAVRAKTPSASISDVLADVGGGRFPVLYWKRGRHCITRTIDGQDEDNCGPTAEPHVAIVKRNGAGALVVEDDLELPTEESPSAQEDDPKWGVTLVKDWDGDGKPELVVVYGYNGPIVWAVGSVAFRSLAVVNLADTLSLSLALVLDRHPQSTNPDTLESTWKISTGSDGKTALQLKLNEGIFDEKKHEYVNKISTVTYGWDAASDKFVKR